MYLFFDTETTGLPQNWSAPVTDLANWPRLVQLAWILYDENGLEQDSRNRIIKPVGFAIPPEISRIHGIAQEQALQEGEPLSAVLSDFSQAVKKSRLLIAHNISFDEKILGAEFIRTEAPDVLSQAAKACTKELSTDYCELPGRYGYKWPTLQELHIKLFGEAFEESHNAAVDVGVCAKCFFELQRLEVIGEELVKLGL